MFSIFSPAPCPHPTATCFLNLPPIEIGFYDPLPPFPYKSGMILFIYLIDAQPTFTNIIHTLRT